MVRSKKQKRELILIVTITSLAGLLFSYPYWSKFVIGRANMTRLGIMFNNHRFCEHITVWSDVCQGWPCANKELCHKDVARGTHSFAYCIIQSQQAMNRINTEEAECLAYANASTSIIAKCNIHKQNSFEKHDETLRDCLQYVARSSEELAPFCTTFLLPHFKDECITTSTSN